MKRGKRAHFHRAWQFARAVMRHDTGDDGRYSLLAKGWEKGYAAALRDVRRLRDKASADSYSWDSYAHDLDKALTELLEPKR